MRAFPWTTFQGLSDELMTGLVHGIATPAQCFAAMVIVYEAMGRNRLRIKRDVAGQPGQPGPAGQADTQYCDVLASIAQHNVSARVYRCHNNIRIPPCDVFSIDRVGQCSMLSRPS